MRGEGCRLTCLRFLVRRPRGRRRRKKRRRVLFFTFKSSSSPLPSGPKAERKEEGEETGEGEGEKIRISEQTAKETRSVEKKENGKS